MAIKPEKIFLPLMVGAAVIGVYLLFRNQDTPQGAVTPNPSSSGVTLPGGGVQPTDYNVPGLSLAPSPAVVLMNPYDTNPSGSATSSQASNKPPSYLAFNFGPAHDLTKQATAPGIAASSDSCGCGGSCKNSCDECNQKNSFTDGTSSTPMQSSKARQVANSDPESWIPKLASNVSSYLLLDDNSPEIPTLTSGAGPSPVSSAPTNGSGAPPHVQIDLQGYLRPPFRSSGFAYQG